MNSSPREPLAWSRRRSRSTLRFERVAGETPRESPAWSGRRWWGVIGAVVVGQLLAVTLVSRPAFHPVAPNPAVGLYYLNTQPAEGWWRTDQPWVADPSESALASSQGFSGPAWRKRLRLEPGAMEWTEPPRWLAATEAGLPLPVHAVNNAPTTPRPLIADRPGVTESRIPFTDRPVVTNSALRVEDGLAGRPLVSMMILTNWEFNELLSPTRVQTIVDENGAVWCATLLSRSGLPAADQYALALVRAARFTPLRDPKGGSGLAWGTLVFTWHTSAPPSTPPVVAP